MELGTSMGFLKATSRGEAGSWTPDLLPDWPEAQTTALAHVRQILLCLSHVPVDGVHAFLYTLQLLC